jgi:hypothetical protein
MGNKQKSILPILFVLSKKRIHDLINMKAMLSPEEFDSPSGKLQGMRSLCIFKAPERHESSIFVSKRRT